MVGKNKTNKSCRTRTLDDEELNSDDDLEGRGSKYETVEEIETHKEVEMGLHPLPLSYDEEVPQFVLFDLLQCVSTNRRTFCTDLSSKDSSILINSTSRISSRKLRLCHST